MKPKLTRILAMAVALGALTLAPDTSWSKGGGHGGGGHGGGHWSGHVGGGHGGRHSHFAGAPHGASHFSESSRR